MHEAIKVYRLQLQKVSDEHFVDNSINRLKQALEKAQTNKSWHYAACV